MTGSPHGHGLPFGVPGWAMSSERRNRKDQYTRLPYLLQDSVAWRTLPDNARTLFLLLCRQHNGGNNGNLSLTFTGAKATGMFKSKAPFYKAFDALWERGLILQTKRGDWGAERKCHLWAVCLWGVNSNPKNGIRKADRSDYWKSWRLGCVSPNYEKMSPLLQRQRAEQSRRTKARIQSKNKVCVQNLDPTGSQNERMRRLP